MKRSILILLTFIIAAVSGSYATASLKPVTPQSSEQWLTMDVPHEIIIFEPLVITASASDKQHDDTLSELIIIEEPLVIYARNDAGCEVNPTRLVALELDAPEQSCSR